MFAESATFVPANFTVLGHHCVGNGFSQCGGGICLRHSLAFLCCYLYMLFEFFSGDPISQNTDCVVLQKNMEMLAMMFSETSLCAPFNTNKVLAHASHRVPSWTLPGLSAKAETRKNRMRTSQLFQEIKIQGRLLEDG